MSDLRSSSPIQIDPSISLKAGAGMQQPTSLLSGNPISTMTGFANIQNLLNQNKLFQQTYAARQLAGEITASSPDIATATQRIAQSPAAPFMGEFLNSMRQMDLALTQQQGAQKQQAQSSFDVLMKGMPGIYNSPTLADAATQWGAMKQSAMALTPAGPAQTMVANAINSVQQGLTAGIDPSSPNAIPQLKKNVQAWFQESGVTPEMYRQLTGQPAPSIQTVTGPQGQPITGVAAPTGTLSPLTMGGPQGGGSGGMGTGVGGPATPNSGASPLAGLPPGAAIVGPTLATKAQIEADQSTAAEMTKDFNTASNGIPTFLNRLDSIQDALTKMPAGGWQAGRAELARWVQGLGRSAGVDETKLDGWVDGINKGQLQAYDVYKSNIMGAALGQLKEAQQGLGRIYRPEVDVALASLGTDTDPRAVMQLMNQARYGVQVLYDKTQKFPDFRAATLAGKMGNLRVGDYNSYYMQHLGSPDTLPTQTDGGLSFGPRPIPKGMTTMMPPPQSSTPAPAVGSKGARTLNDIFGTQ